MKNKYILTDVKYLRVLAIFLVVLGHSANVYRPGWVFQSRTSSDFYYFLTNLISTFHMHLFVFVSGIIYCFCRKEKNYYNSFIELASSKFKRLLIPYFLLGSLYMIPVWIKLGINNPSYKIQFMDLITGKHFGYLWFLMMLFMVFIIFYSLEKFINKRYVLLNILLFLFLNIISSKITTLFSLNNTFLYLIYFYLGYEVFIYRHKIYFILNSKLKTIILIVFSALSFYFLFTINNIHLNYLIIFLKPIILAILGITICYILAYKLRILSTNNTTFKIINYFDKKSFNIYLLHEPIIFIVLSLIIKSNINPHFLVSLCFITSSIISLLINIIYNYIRKSIDKTLMLKPKNTLEIN